MVLVAFTFSPSLGHSCHPKWGCFKLLSRFCFLGAFQFSFLVCVGQYVHQQRPDALVCVMALFPRAKPKDRMSNEPWSMVNEVRSFSSSFIYLEVNESRINAQNMFLNLFRRRSVSMWLLVFKSQVLLFVLFLFICLFFSCSLRAVFAFNRHF